MYPYLIPPRFKSHDVKGDGNCFYYAVLSSINRFQYKEREQDADGLKKLLSEYLQQPRARRSFDDLTRRGLAKRLRTPKAWAEAAEIRLTADFLDVCIFVFKPLFKNRGEAPRWSLSSYVPEEFRGVCEHAGRALSYQDILETYFCQDTALCGPKTIFLLNVHENHYVPLQRRRRSEHREPDRARTRSHCDKHTVQRSCDNDADCSWMPLSLLNLASRVKHGGICTDIRHLLK